MNEQAKKLKRGLKELSVLFRDGSFSHAPVPKQIPESIGIDCLTVFNSQSHGDSSMLLNFLASKLAHLNNLCSLISIKPSHQLKSCEDISSKTATGVSGLLEEEKLGHYFNRFAMSWEQFDHVCCSGCQRDAAPFARNRTHQTIFLDFDYENVPYFQKIIPILDKFLMVLRPDVENMTEAYKMIKAVAVLNPDLDYYFIYDGITSDGRGEILFERFSEMTARRLGIHLVWLGYFYMDQTEKKICSNLSYEHLFLTRKNKTDIIEKFMLADLVRPAFHVETELAV